MGNGEWGMGNGEWGMGNGEWGMGMQAEMGSSIGAPPSALSPFRFPIPHSPFPALTPLVLDRLVGAPLLFLELLLDRLRLFQRLQLCVDHGRGGGGHGFRGRRIDVARGARGQQAEYGGDREGAEHRVLRWRRHPLKSAPWPWRRQA